MFHSRIDAGAWTWIRRIAILSILSSVLVAVTQLGGAGESSLEVDDVAVSQAAVEGARSNKHSKIFLVEENTSLQTDRALLMKAETFDEGASTFDEDEEFYSRMLGKKYGSGPFPSKSSKSGGMSKGGSSGSKGSKSSKSKGKGDGSSGSNSEGKGDRSSGSKGSKSGKSEGKGNASHSSDSKGSKSSKSEGKGGSDSRSKPMRSEGKGAGSVSKDSVSGNSGRKGSKDMAKKKKKDGKKKGGKKRKKKKPKRRFEDHRHLLRLKTTDETNVLPATTHLTMEELQKITSRFYIYDDPMISQREIVDEHRAMGKSAFGGPADLDHVKTDMKGEQLILQALQHHPLRTLDPEESDIFVVPTPITELLSYGCQWENCTWYDDAFTALSKQPTFKSAQGHKHVIIALSWPSFNKRYSAFVPALSRNYARLENVTVAHNYDPFGCFSLRDRTEASSGQNGFQKVYQRELPVTNAFSLGLGFNDPFPVHLPTYEKFETSDFFVFYRSRVKSFAYGSTVYRNAPLSASVIEKLPPSSIGHDVALNEWIHGFTSSKFCLVIRGDTPHSHSLLYAVRAGCIPVVVSDDYPAYATPFKSSMAIEDFAIFITEQDFLTNPTQQLLQLQDLPEDFIRRKLDNLYVAQTMVVPNHPRSVFVQAFLKEVFEAEKNVIPRTPEVKVHEDYAILSGCEFLYRYPSTFPESSASSWYSEEPSVIVGVMSKSRRFDARHAIRGTWAAESHHGVFFVVAGPWEDIEEEFHLYGDMLWVGMLDDDSIATNKVQLFLQAVNAHVDSYDYVMKANDDSYVWLDDVEHHLAKSKPDYWGGCKTKYTKSSQRTTGNAVVPHRRQRPKYAYGTGYVLSREFNECAARNIESIGLMSNEEDVATGFLAELCGVSCNDDGLDWWKTPKENKRRGLKFIDGHKNTSEEMLYKHWYVLWKRGGWDA